MQGKLDSSLNLVGTEASGTSVHMARSTVDNGLNPLNIGLPGPVGTSVGVGNLNTEGNALATIITLRHNCTSYLHNKIKSNLCFAHSRLNTIAEIVTNCKCFL